MKFATSLEFLLRALFGACCLVAVTIVAHGTEIKSVVPAVAQAQAVITKSLNDFLTFNSDPAQHDRFWADDLVYTSSAGLVKTKAEIMRGMAESAKSPTPKAAPSAAYRAEDVLIRIYGETAALTFRLVALYPDGTKLTYRNSGTLLRRQEKWQVVTWQATKEPTETK